MSTENTRTYCLFCTAGQEGRVADRLERDGYAAFAPQIRRWKPGKGGIKKSVCRLLPGYVFFEAEAEPNWADIRSLPPVIRPLQYEDGARALRGSDLAFTAWLKRCGEVIEMTRVVQAGTRIEFVEGPLKELAGRIVQVNKSRRQVQVAIGESGSLMRTVWCSIEYIEANAGMDGPDQNSRI